jgi:hypothetical protein
LESSITGVAVKRAGGGSGAYATGTSPGADYGGGLGAADSGNGTAGAPYTGGGGGGCSGGTSGAGGSGIVIIRYDMTLPKGTVFIMR